MVHCAQIKEVIQRLLREVGECQTSGSKITSSTIFPSAREGSQFHSMRQEHTNECSLLNWIFCQFKHRPILSRNGRGSTAWNEGTKAPRRSRRRWRNFISVAATSCSFRMAVWWRGITFLEHRRVFDAWSISGSAWIVIIVACAVGKAAYNLATFLTENGSVTTSMSKFPFAVHEHPCTTERTLGCARHGMALPLGVD